MGVGGRGEGGPRVGGGHVWDPMMLSTLTPPDARRSPDSLSRAGGNRSSSCSRSCPGHGSCQWSTTSTRTCSPRPRRKWNIFHMARAGRVHRVRWCRRSSTEPRRVLRRAGRADHLPRGLARGLPAQGQQGRPRHREAPHHVDLRDQKHAGRRRPGDTGPKSSAKVALAIKAADDKASSLSTCPCPSLRIPELETRSRPSRCTPSPAPRLQIDIQPATKDTYQVSVLIDGVRQNQGDPLRSLRRPDHGRLRRRPDGRQRPLTPPERRAADRRRRRPQHPRRLVAGRLGGMHHAALRPREGRHPKSDAWDSSLAVGGTQEDRRRLKGVVSWPAGRRRAHNHPLRRHAHARRVHAERPDSRWSPRAPSKACAPNKFDPAADAAAGASGGAEYSRPAIDPARRDPQVVSVAELPDAATAKGNRQERPRSARASTSRSPRAMRSPPSPHSSSRSAIRAQVGYGVPRRARVLHGPQALHQLPRRLPPRPRCSRNSACREGKIQLFKKGRPGPIKNKPEVCPVCKGSGYVGQEGIFEVFFPTRRGARPLSRPATCRACARVPQAQPSRPPARRDPQGRRRRNQRRRGAACHG